MINYTQSSFHQTQRNYQLLQYARTERLRLFQRYANAGASFSSFNLQRRNLDGLIYCRTCNRFYLREAPSLQLARPSNYQNSMNYASSNPYYQQGVVRVMRRNVTTGYGDPLPPHQLRSLNQSQLNRPNRSQQSRSNWDARRNQHPNRPPRYRNLPGRLRNLPPRLRSMLEDVNAMRLNEENQLNDVLSASFNEEFLHVQRTGFSEEAIHSYFKTRIGISSTTDKDKESQVCVICQDEYQMEEQIATLSCGHEYHENCIKQWLLEKNECPICRRAVLVDENLKGSSGGTCTL